MAGQSFNYGACVFAQIAGLMQQQRLDAVLTAVATVCLRILFTLGACTLNRPAASAWIGMAQVVTRLEG